MLGKGDPDRPDWRCIECDHPISAHDGRKCKGMVDSGFSHGGLQHNLYFLCDCRLSQKEVETAFRARFT